MLTTRHSGAFFALVLSIVLSACSTPADVTSTTDLEPQFGTRGYDEVTDVAYGKSLTLYAVGTWDRVNNYDYSLGSDAFVRRYDRNGNLIWENFLDIEPAYENDPYYENYTAILTARAVAVDGSSNAIVAWSAEYYENGNVVATFNYLTKYSSSGSKIWRVYTNGALNDVATDSSGNIYAISGSSLIKYTSGGSQSWSRSQPSPDGVTVSSSNNVYIVREDGAVVKFNGSGTQLYLKTGQLDGYIEGGALDRGEPYKIAAGLSDELYVADSRYNFTSYGCDAGIYADNYTMRLFKLSNTGTRQWVKDAASGAIGEPTCEGSELIFLSGLGVASDTSGNAYIAGYQSGSGYYNQDGFIAKYSRAGALSWKKGFGTSRDDTATSVATYDGSEVFMGGVTQGFLVHRQLGGSGDAVIREVNSSGTLSWAR